MTEQEWRDCDDPQKMLAFLRGVGNASERKLRLFACACARRLWPSLTEPCCHQALLVAERFADGLAAKQDVAKARRSLPADFRNRTRRAIFDRAWDETGDGDEAEARAGAWAGAWDTAHYTLRAKALEAAWLAAFQRLAEQAELVHEVFGSPFRPVTVDPSRLMPTVTQVTQAAYEHRLLPSGHLDAVRLSVLADALEDAGCADTNILSHLRDPGPHVRGCHVVGALLGKS